MGRQWRALLHLPRGWHALDPIQTQTLLLLASYVPLVVAMDPPPGSNPLSALMFETNARAQLRCVGPQSAENMGHLRRTSALMISFDADKSATHRALASGMLVLQGDDDSTQIPGVSHSLLRTLPDLHDLGALQEEIKEMACAYAVIYNEYLLRASCPEDVDHLHHVIREHFTHGTIPKPYQPKNYLQRVQTLS